MGFAKIVTLCAASAVAGSFLPQEVDAHAFLLLPKPDFSIPEKNFYAYVVPGDKAPPLRSYFSSDAEKNSIAFTANYKKLNSPSLKDFILTNQVPDAAEKKTGGTAECGFSKPNVTPQPLPDHVEFGNYNLQITAGLHPGPCEAWCDDDLVVPFTEDCRTRFHKPIPYEKAKCVGKSRFTFYWLATHFAPFQVYIGCVPLEGASGGGSSGGGAANNTAPGTVKPSPAATPTPMPSAAPEPTKAPTSASTPAPSAAGEASASKCGVKRN